MILQSSAVSSLSPETGATFIQLQKLIAEANTFFFLLLTGINMLFTDKLQQKQRLNVMY